MSDPSSSSVNVTDESKSEYLENKKLNERTDSKTTDGVELLNFKGLSLLEMSQQLSSIDSSSPPPEDPLNTSDFFNSQGELILSGLSEWSSDSDQEPGDENGEKVETVKSDEEGSDGSTASTESITAYQPQPGKVSNNVDVNVSSIGQVGDTVDFVKTSANSTATGSEKHKIKRKSVRFGHSNISFGGEPAIQNINSKGNSEPIPSEDYFWSEPVKDADSFRAVIHNVPNYGVRVYPGFQGLNVMNTSASSGWRILPGTENEQIMCRAPNFRTPGGYKPPLEEEIPRNMTSAEITEEVRQMYAEDAERELDSQILYGSGDNKNIGTDRCVTRKPPVKRKLFNTEGELRDSDTSNEFKDQHRNVRFSDIEVEEKPAVKSHSFVCGKSDVEETDVYESGLKPIASSSAQSIQFTGDISRCLPRQHRNKNKDVNLNYSGPDTRKTNLAALDKLWRDIQETKQHMEADMRSRMRAQDYPISDFASQSKAIFQSKPDIAINSNQPVKNLDVTVKSTVNQVVKRNSPIASKLQRHARRGGKQMQKGQSRGSGKGSGFIRSPRSKRNSKSDLDSDNFDLESLELSSILHEAQLEESDLDEILSQINEFPIPGHLLDESESPVELTSALQQLQITDWAKSGANEYVDRFYEEKYKRQQCEKEILQAQKELLEQRERIAVLEGLLKSKEAAVIKSTNLWEALVRKWKSHETKCKKTVTGLETEQKELKTQLEDRKVRLGEYESEMDKAVSLTEEFKVKNEELVQEIYDYQVTAAIQRKELENKVEELTVQAAERKAEKEAIGRALRECQSKLDETKLSLESANKQIIVADEQSNCAVKMVGDISKENDRLRECVSDLRNEKTSLESKLNDTVENLKTEKAEKERLESTVKSDLETKLKEQREKLHEYYNSRLQGILKSESEKMIMTEKEFLKTNEKKFLELEKNSKARLMEMELKFNMEYESLKKQYETEILDLRRENSKKGNLIGAVSRQLKSFECGNGVTDLNTESSGSTAPIKSRGHSQSKLSKVNSSAAVQPRKSQTHSQALAHSTLAVGVSHLQPLGINSILNSPSVEMKNCIASLVNAYKEKNLSNS